MNTLQKLAEIRVMELREYVLPSIAEYIKNTYDIDISVEELATEALTLPIKDSKITSTKNSSPIGSPSKDQMTKGCQFPMKNSRTRPNMPCGKSANGNKYFCKKCTEKASFSSIVKEVSVKLGITVEELTRDIGVAKKKEEGIAIRAPRVPEKRDKYTAGVDKQSSKKKEEKVEEKEEQIELSSIPDMLDCFCYDDRTKIVYYFDDNDPEAEAVAFGFYKDDKIYPLTEQQKMEVKASGFEIGNYKDYDLGDREVE